MKARIVYFFQLVAVAVGTVVTSSLVESYTGSKRMGAVAFLASFFLLLTVHVGVSTYLEIRRMLRIEDRHHG